MHRRTLRVSLPQLQSHSWMPWRPQHQQDPGHLVLMPWGVTSSICELMLPKLLNSPKPPEHQLQPLKWAFTYLSIYHIVTHTITSHLILQIILHPHHCHPPTPLLLSPPPHLHLASQRNGEVLLMVVGRRLRSSESSIHVGNFLLTL